MNGDLPDEIVLPRGGDLKWLVRKKQKENRQKFNQNQSVDVQLKTLFQFKILAALWHYEKVNREEMREKLRELELDSKFNSEVFDEAFDAIKKDFDEAVAMSVG